MTRDAERIAVAVCTRRRPRMLADLMASLQTLDVPQGTELLFLFVENDTTLTIEEQVAAFSRWSGWQAKALHVADPGIAHARNAALEGARAAGADWLAFVDDDELVRHDWLRQLRAGARDAGAQLAGGPVRPVGPKNGCSDSEADVLAYYEQAAQVSDARKEAASQLGRRFDVATNNWLADLAALDAAGIRFDPAFNLSGGEDTDVSRRAHGAGLTLAWVPAAIVTEEVPPDRLTAAFLYERARDQSITKFELRSAARSALNARLDGIGQILSKSVSGALRIALSLILGRYSYYRGLRALGIASGYLAGLRGTRQARYTEVTGE